MVQAVGKILRHGYSATDEPDGLGITASVVHYNNKADLEKELDDLLRAAVWMHMKGDIFMPCLKHHGFGKSNLPVDLRYFHHQHED